MKSECHAVVAAALALRLSLGQQLLLGHWVMSHDADISVFYLPAIQPQSLTPEIFIRARIPC